MFTTLGNSIPRNGLVGEWLLDGNALDTSGSGYNGTATNITYVKTTRGYQSQCGSFNGSTSQVSIPHNTSLNPGNGNFTLSFFIKDNNFGVNELKPLITKRRPTSPFTMYSILKGNPTAGPGAAGLQLGFYLIGTSTSPPDFYFGHTTNNIFIDGNWKHIVLVRDGIRSVKIYVNGIPQAITITNNSGTDLNIDNTESLTIGKSNYGDSTLSNKDLVRYYNTALSQEEIQLLYLEGQKLLGPTNIAKYPKLFEGLVGYWDFKGTAHNLVDGTNTTVSGPTLTTNRFGQSNSAYSFLGGTNNITLPNNLFGTTSNTNRTFHFIFKPTDLSVYRYIYSPYNSDGIMSMICSSTAFYVGNDNDVSADTSATFTFTTGNYYYVTLTFANNTAKIYINGNLIITNTGWIYRSSDKNTMLGRYSPTISDGNSFIGVMDEVYMINRTFTDNEVKLLYDITSKETPYPNPSYDLASLREGLVLDLNEQGKDLSGNGNNGTLVNSPTVVRQGKAKGLSYNGSNQYVTNTTNINNSSFTVSSFIKPNSLSNNYYTVMGGNSMSGLLGKYYLQPKVADAGFVGKSKFAIIDTSDVIYNVYGPSLEIGKTYLLTGVFDLSNNKIIFYVDGIKQGETSISGTIKNNTINYIGSGFYNGAVVDYYNGNVFNPRIRNRALTNKEVEALYYSTKGNFIY